MSAAAGRVSPVACSKRVTKEPVPGRLTPSTLTASHRFDGNTGNLLCSEAILVIDLHCAVFALRRDHASLTPPKASDPLGVTRLGE